MKYGSRSVSLLIFLLPLPSLWLQGIESKKQETRRGKEWRGRTHSTAFLRSIRLFNFEVSLVSLSHRREGRQALDASQDLRGKKEVNTWMSLRTDYLWCMTWKIRRKRGHLYCFFSSWILSRILWRLFTSLSFLCCLLNVNVLSASNV